jgi:ankyrin repeat protein
MMRKSRRNTSSRDSLMLAGDAIHTTDPQQDQLPPIEEPHEIAPAKPKSFGRGLRHKGTRLFAALRVSGDDRREHGKSLLIVASQGNVDRIQQLIDAGGDPNYKAKEDDESALHKAARAGHSEAISVLLTSLAKLNAKNKIGETPLHLASGVAVGPVRVLVNADARVDLSGLDGWTALHNAAVWGLPDVLEVLVKAGAPVNAKSKGGHTALHQACYSDSSECVRILLESDAWVDAKAGTTKRNCGFYDATPLHMACYMATQKIEFDIAIIRLLIEAGADLNAKTESGKNGREITPLHIAARGRRADIVQLLIDSGADFDARAPVSMRIIWADDLQIWDDYNVIYTPLHFAVAFNSTPTIATLLKAGASGATDTGDRWEWQLLHTAALHGAVASATCLLRETETLRINTRHLVGTPLHIAASKGYSAIALLLLEHGADVNSRGNKKRTPLHRVLTARATNNSKSLESSIKINSRFYPLVTLLLDYGADVNAIDEDGETPLSMLLCPRSKSLWKHRSVDHDFAKALLEGGADIQGSKSTKGDLITQAWVRRDGSLMEFLIKHGATITKDLYNKAWRDAVTAKGYKPVNSYRGHDPHILHQARRKFEQVKESYSKRCTLLDAYAEADVASYGQSLVSEESNRIGNLTRKEKERRNQKEREIEEFNEMQEAGLNGLKYERRRENRRDAVTRAKERGSLAVPPPKNVKRRKPRKSASSDSIDVNLSNESES